ncbi:MAG: cyclic nucleotide-binding domain-containing protein [Candidatus Sericytochromatia bacterium]|nr:cyclic nucleotide-binding domain-containing protein [Candidatus Sericytochromatia bacterium]
MGLLSAEHLAVSPSRGFDDLDAALEWVENALLQEAQLVRQEERSLTLAEMELFKGRKATTIDDLAACVVIRSYASGVRIFARGDQGDELFLIRKGAVRIDLPLENGQSHHLSTFGQGDFFGEMAFLDRQVRSADAVTSEATELYVLSRQAFDHFAEIHTQTAAHLLEGLARVLATRLRDTNTELRSLRLS